MAAEPMEEDDSFNDPLPRAVPFPRHSVTQTAAPLSSKPVDSDPDSDDSFETFAPTQTTTGNSLKSSASSTQSTEAKPPPVQFPPPSKNPPKHVHQQNVSKSPLIPQLPRNQVPTRPQINTVQSVQQKPSASATGRVGIGVHSAVANTRNGVMTKSAAKNNYQTTSQAPASPNSLARHRSANSGLRNAAIHTPSMRVANMFATRTTPPFDTSSRPSTPSGDVIMLRDQLENEKRKVLRLQADFQKDVHKKEEEHLRHLAAKDLIIEKQKKDLEMMKSSIACRKSEIYSTPKTTVTQNFPTNRQSSTAMISPSLHPIPEIKKIYPKIPSTEHKSFKTPPRHPVSLGNISVFRHPFKENDEDTFQVDTSFEPSATSTPKFTGIPRTGLRRPLDLGEAGSSNEHNRGAPTPKRKPVFRKERKKRTHEEIQEELRKIWEEIGIKHSMSGQVSQFFPPKSVKKDEENEEDGDDQDWIDHHLARNFRRLECRKKTDTNLHRSFRDRSEKVIPAKTRSKILQQVEQKPDMKKMCGICRIDAPSSAEHLNSILKKEWELVEDQKLQLSRKRAEELRLLHYTSLVSSINRKGIQELDGASKKSEIVEQEFQKRLAEIEQRSLEQVRNEKREQWKSKIMDELTEKGELLAFFELTSDGGRNDDYIWTEDEDDEDWWYPTPYNHPKSTLCSQCAFRQQRQRRIAKREREQAKIKVSCLKEYGIEKRESLRNMSVLTKSRIEAADKSLFRENEVSGGSPDFMNMDTGEEEDEEDIF